MLTLDVMFSSVRSIIGGMVIFEGSIVNEDFGFV